MSSGGGGGAAPNQPIKIRGPFESRPPSPYFASRAQKLEKKGGEPLNMKRALFAVLALAACSTASSQSTPTPSPVPGIRAVTTNAAAIAKARADSARYPYTDADVHFMTMMIAHHAQAVRIASWAASHGASDAVQRLADRVVNGQQDDIVIMQQWLMDRQKPVPDASGAGHHMHMAGMLTEEQLRQLDAARGADFDRLFLTFMIQHHRGAVTMVKELFGSQGAAQDLLVFKFASDVQVDQTTEIARMEQMLDNLTTNQRNQP
jgi:uncharacterized protein (DUF305 family)